MENAKIIFTDIDGTLTDFESGIIPASAIGTLYALVKNGHKIILCTGRSKQDIESVLLELPISGTILACGAHIVYQDKTIYTQCLKIDMLKTLINEFLQHKIGFVLEGIERNYLYGKAFDVYLQWEKINPGFNYTTLDDLIKILEHRHSYSFDQIKDEDLKQIVKISFYAENDQYDLIKNILISFIQHIEFTLDQNVSLSVFGEITGKNCNKATGIDYILKYLKEDQFNTIAIGDGTNDIPMLKTAHLSIAMGNASDKLKEHADFVSKNVLDNGFEYAFKTLKLI